MTTKLCNLSDGETAIVDKIYINGAMRRRLLDIGLIEGTKVKCIMRSPYGDPIAFLIRGTIIALRSNDSCKITVKKIKREET